MHCKFYTLTILQIVHTKAYAKASKIYYLFNECLFNTILNMAYLIKIYRFPVFAKLKMIITLKDLIYCIFKIELMSFNIKAT